MTENSKIFLTKTSIMNLLSQQQLSIGLSLYIIKDIQQQLTKLYNDIVQKQLAEESKQSTQNIQQEEEEEIVDLSDTGLSITSFQETEDQAD